MYVDIFMEQLILMIIIVTIVRYGNWTDIDYAVTKTRESYGFNNAVSINISK